MASSAALPNDKTTDEVESSSALICQIRLRRFMVPLCTIARTVMASTSGCPLRERRGGDKLRREGASSQEFCTKVDVRGRKLERVSMAGFAAKRASCERCVATTRILPATCLRAPRVLLLQGAHLRAFARHHPPERALVLASLMPRGFAGRLFVAVAAK